MTNENPGQTGREDRPGEGAGRGNLAENQERQALRKRVQDGETLTAEEQARLDELEARGGDDEEEEEETEEAAPA